MRGRSRETNVQAGTTMMLRNLKFAFNSAWQSFWRNLAVSLAAVLSITLILILAGINLLVGHAFSQVLDSFRERVSEISINVADDTPLDRKSTRLNSSHPSISYAVFCLKKKK